MKWPKKDTWKSNICIKLKSIEINNNFLGRLQQPWGYHNNYHCDNRCHTCSWSTGTINHYLKLSLCKSKILLNFFEEWNKNFYYELPLHKNATKKVLIVKPLQCCSIAVHFRCCFRWRSFLDQVYIQQKMKNCCDLPCLHRIAGDWKFKEANEIKKNILTSLWRSSDNLLSVDTTFISKPVPSLDWL